MEIRELQLHLRNVLSEQSKVLMTTQTIFIKLKSKQYIV